METICGISCSECSRKESCKGCVATNGRPFGGACVVAECCKAGGKEYLDGYKAQLIREIRSLGISDLPEVTELFALCGSYVNLEYTLPGGQRARLLDDSSIYLGCQLEKPEGERCYGLVADDDHMLVCEYGCNGADPEIIVFRKRDPRIGRIAGYENVMNEARKLLAAGQTDGRLARLIDALDAYYQSEQWKQDYAADEAGLLPGDLKRGVLSEDGIYDLLENYKEAIQS